MTKSRYNKMRENKFYKKLETILKPKPDHSDSSLGIYIRPSSSEVSEASVVTTPKLAGPFRDSINWTKLVD